MNTLWWLHAPGSSISGQQGELLGILGWRHRLHRGTLCLLHLPGKCSGCNCSTGLIFYLLPASGMWHSRITERAVCMPWLSVSMHDSSISDHPPKGEPVLFVEHPCHSPRWCTRSCSGARWIARGSASGATRPCAPCRSMRSPSAPCSPTPVRARRALFQFLCAIHLCAPERLSFPCIFLVLKIDALHAL